MSKITYTDKEYIYENASIPEINKITDGNMNEIKSVVNENDTRLTTAEGEIDTAQTDINNAEAVIGNETDTYSASSTYALGSLVIYNSLLYKCTTAITVAEAWNGAKWTQVTLKDVVEKKTSVILKPYTAYTYNFAGLVYASQDVTIFGNITDYENINISVEDAGYAQNITVDTALLNAGTIFRGRLLLAGIQFYYAISKVSANVINVHLEHNSAISGTKTVYIKMKSI